MGNVDSSHERVHISSGGCEQELLLWMAIAVWIGVKEGVGLVCWSRVLPELITPVAYHCHPGEPLELLAPLERPLA